MKFLISILLTILLSFTASLFFPWWSIALCAFFISVFIPQQPGKSFLTGFISLLILWGGLSFWISYNNNHILAHKASLLIIKMDNPLLLILITALVGALVAGFAAMSGSYLKSKKTAPSKVII